MSEKKTGALGYGRVIIAVCFLIMFAGNFAQFQLSPIAPQLMAEYNLSVGQFSALFSAAMVPGAALSIVCGVICDKYGVRGPMIAAGAISLAGLVIRVFARSFFPLFLAMVMAGVVCTFINSNLAKIMSRWLPMEKVGMGIGIAMAGATASQAVSISTTALMPSTRSAFLLSVGLSTTALIAWILLGRERPRDMPPMPYVSPMEGLKVCVRSRNIWLTGLTVGLVTAGAMPLTSMLPAALQEVRGMSDVAAGAVSSAVMFGNFAGVLAGALICAKIGSSRRFERIFLPLGAVAVAFSWMAPEGFPMLAALFLTGFFTYGAVVVLLSAPAVLPEIGPRYAGAGGGIISTLQLTGAVVLASYIIVPLCGHNYKLLFMISGAVVLAALLTAERVPELYHR